MRYLFNTHKYLQNLALAICALVGSLGSEGPALFTARTRNWYWFPSFKPGTRASQAGDCATKKKRTFAILHL
jgi:hypothetical protein